MLKLIKSFLLGRSWIFILIIGLISAGAAGTVAWKLKDLIDSQNYSELKQEYDEYKFNTINSINKENQTVIETIRNLTRDLKEISMNFELKQQQNREFSNSLIKELYDQNGKSCPLSPAVEHYLDRLRINQQSRRVN